MMFSLVDDDKQIGASLRELADPDSMLSPTGWRTIGPKDQFYKQGSNYWRGAIWINVNFLLLGGLYKTYIGDHATGPSTPLQ